MKVTGKIKVRSCTDWPNVNERNWEAVFKGPSASCPSPIAPGSLGSRSRWLRCRYPNDRTAPPTWPSSHRGLDLSLTAAGIPSRSPSTMSCSSTCGPTSRWWCGDGWDKHGVPPTANPQILRYVGCGILDYGRACSQWLDSVHSSDVRSWPAAAVRQTRRGGRAASGSSRPEADI
jgi:hypothetical protein